MDDINILAVVLSAFSTFMIGGIWYGPLFDKVWMRENKFSNADLAKRNMPVVFILSFLFALISATVLEALIGRDAEMDKAILTSLAAGVGFVATSIGTIYLFEGRSLKLFLINAGYMVMSFLVMGVILGVMG